MPDVARTHLPGLFGSAEFMEAYAAAIARAPPVEIGASRTDAGTVDAAIVAYYNSVAFGDPATENALALSTQKMRRAILERFRTDHGGKRIALLGQHHIIALLAPGKQEIFREFLKP
ncbi:MAG: hypothetical protein WA796_23085 [Pseudolabrys sp.]|jgi:hypothetical protein